MLVVDITIIWPCFSQFPSSLHCRTLCSKTDDGATLAEDVIVVASAAPVVCHASHRNECENFTRASQCPSKEAFDVRVYIYKYKINRTVIVIIVTDRCVTPVVRYGKQSFFSPFSLSQFISLYACLRLN